MWVKRKLTFKVANTANMRTLVNLTLIVSIFTTVPMMLIGQVDSTNGDRLSTLAELYESGSIEQLTELINLHSPLNNEERAAKLYYQARISIEQDGMMSLLEALVKDYQFTQYGQKGLLELAKISLLERDYRKSCDYLLKINNDDLEKEFMLATVYLKLNLIPEAIRAAQNFIDRTTDFKKREVAYLTIVEAHILNNQYQQALTLLERLRLENIIQEQRSMVFFKEGYVLEMLDRIGEAVNKYKQVITRFPYTECCFQAEKRLYDLTIADRISHTELSMVSPVTERPDRTESFIPPFTEPVIGEQFYLQVGAFADESNARNYSQHLKSLGYPNEVIPKMVLNSKLFAVAVGPFANRQEAIAKQPDLKSKLNLDSFIIQH